MSSISSDHRTPTYSNEQLAELAGFSNVDDNQTETESPFSLAEELEDSKPSFASNPLLRLAVVATGAGALFLTLYALVENVKLPQTTADKPVPVQTENTAPTTDNNGIIKTGLAFGDASNDLAALSETEQAEEANDESNTTNATAATSPAATPTVRPTPVVTQATPVMYRAPVPAPSSAPTPMRVVAPPAPIMPSSLDTVALPTEPPPLPATEAESSDEPEGLSEQPESQPQEETLPTRAIPTGSRVDAELTTSVFVSSGVSIPARMRLTEPLTTAQGEQVLATGTELIAKVVNTSGGIYLLVTGALINDTEHPFEEEAMIALGAEGLLQNPNGGTTSDNRNGIDIEEALVTGAIATLDIDGDDLLRGLGLSVLDQLMRRDERPVQQASEAWAIPEATPLRVYTTAPITLPVSESSSATQSLIDSAGASDSLIGFGSVPTSFIKMVLRPDENKTIDFLRRGETVVSVTLDDDAMVSLTFDQPLESGQTGLLHAALKPKSTAKTTHLDVVTVGSNRARHWHRFELHRG